MFTIFGANGNTGTVVTAKLIAAGKKVRAVVRDAHKAPAGAEAFVGEVTDAAAVAKALAGAEGAYLLMPPDNAATDLVARNAKIIDHYVAGLSAHKVPYAVMLSSVGAQKPSGTGPIQTCHYAEAKLPTSGAKLTFVRAAYFIENILANAYPMKHDGVLPVFGGGEGYPFPMVATRDIGEVAAEALLHPPAQTEWIELSGPKEYSFNDAAAEATKILGRAVTTKVLPLDAVVPTFTGFGMSPNVAGLYKDMIAAFGSGLGFEGKGRAVRGKTDLASVLKTGLS
jgi:uncharacterized protein YbjT (DUF2867 family)